MYPNSRYFVLKLVPIRVPWGQCIYYMNTWTLRAERATILKDEEKPKRVPKRVPIRILMDSIGLIQVYG